MSSESHSPETFNFASNAEGAAGQDLAQAETVFDVRPGDAAESDGARSTRGAVTTTAENTLDASRSRGYPAYGEESDGLAIGMTLDGKYEISALIGAGGMGSVYRARHLTLNRDVAVKVIKRNFAGDRDALERFQREAQLCALIEHPNSVRVFDYGVQGNVCFLVMEFLRGETLRERLAKRGRLPLPEAVAIADRMLQVLSVLHRKGVIHRDLKPDNIFFSHQAEAEGETEAEVVKLIDFGIAKQSLTEEGASVTRTGAIIGTPFYMSPEQCEGRAVDGRSDIYSMGIIICETLTGRAPFVGDSLLGVMYQHVNAPPPDLREMAPELPSAVCDVVKRMLEKSPDRRYQKASEAAAALREAAGFRTEDGRERTASPDRSEVPRPSAATAPMAAPAPPRAMSPVVSPRRRRTLTAVALVVALLGAVGAWRHQTVQTALLTVRYAVGAPPVSLAAALSAEQKATFEKCSERLVAHLATEIEERRQNPNAWSMAQMAVAVGGRRDFEVESVERFFQVEKDAQAHAWRDSPSGLPHTGVSGWVAASFSRMNRRLEPATLQFFLNNQQPDGWWLIYIGNSAQTETTAALPSLDDDYASVYATAMAVLGLHAQLKLGIEDQKLSKRVENAIQLGRKWLWRTRVANAARWFDYPFNEFHKEAIGLSGLVLHALHHTADEADADALADLDRLWLASLPDLELDAKVADPSLVPLPMYQREDVTKHYALQWAMIATADAYVEGSEAQKARAVVWLRRVAERLDGVTTGVIGKTDWIAAEWLIALRYVQGERVM